MNYFELCHNNIIIEVLMVRLIINEYDDQYHEKRQLLFSTPSRSLKDMEKFIWASDIRSKPEVFI